MKKVFALVLAVLMLLTLVACSGKKASEVTPSDSTSKPASTEPKGQDQNSTTEKETTKPTETEQPSEPKILKLSLSGVPANMWCTIDNNGTSMELQRYINGLLYAQMPVDGKPILMAQLAAGEPIDVNGDGKTWNIAISPNAKWENGEAITADTFVYTFKMALDPKLVLENASLVGKNYITIANSIEYYTQASTGKPVAWEEVGFRKVDDMTIQVETASAVNAELIMRHFSTFPTTPIYPPLFESCLSADGTTTTYGSAQDKILSSGAFKFSKWIDGSVYEFVKNENFARADLIKLDGIVHTVIEDAGTRLQMFEQGNIDYISLDAAGLDQYGDDPRIESVYGRRVYSIEFNTANTEKPIISNENFRLALLYATNRAELGKLTNLPPATGLISRTSIATVDGTTFRALAEKAGYEPKNNGYDPDLAVKYFEKALEETNQTNVEITVLCNSGDRITTIAEYLQEHWAKIFGADRFKLIIDSQPSAQAGDLRKGWKTNANAYEITLIQWNFSGGDYDPIQALKAYTNSYSGRYAPYDYDVLNDLFAEAGKNALNQEKRNELAMEMEKYILEHAVVVPLVYEVNQCMFSDRVILAVGEYITGFNWGWNYMDIAS